VSYNKLTGTVVGVAPVEGVWDFHVKLDANDWTIGAMGYHLEMLPEDWGEGYDQGWTAGFKAASITDILPLDIEPDERKD
jgi:hypothetical protein